MLDSFIILITTFIATLLSSMSGGGASIIVLPVFLSLGMSFPLATLVHKISAVFWTIPAAYNYLKDRKINWVFLLLFALIGLIGAYFGILVVININQRVLEIATSIMILTLVIYTYFQKNLGLKEKKIYSKTRQLAAYPIALLMGFYESIFGAGNAIAFATLTFYTKGFDFIDALGYYFSIAFFWVSFGSILLIKNGNFDLYFIIPSIIGSVFGAYLGSKFAKYKGNKFIKTLFVIIGGVLGLKLLLNL
jgi:uncharacterized protein